MAYAIQWLRSLVFIILMYLMMPLVGLFFFPLAIFDRKWAYYVMHLYCRWVRWSAHWIVGLKSEIRGEVPTGEVIVASKHQSFFDILIIFGAVPKARFIMKAQLIWAPILGYYAYRIGCVFVDRGKRGQAIRKMVADVKSGKQDPGQLVIFPQGTRVAVGVKKPYKVGTAILYTETGQEVVPVATNVGVFWKRHGFYRKPGLAVVEFLPPIKPGLSTKEFMEKLEDVIEAASDKLTENS
ncbi:MAG: 1-acyl-sn-glycerol-3-phosphate acyltransferase [Rhodobacteraceae bacterium]|nr:1-acyl-sn-glycerol-3-phosphate acyltransferase [Paracoccaceae bacterium]